ncbi:3-deoxy-7-phosphoheptulonate synthase [Actinopolyspora mortivallis]|uniref:3-deoxy-7-phosphoheptulonate synthase n=1 Tax=Actinopolyspora mortivallis TaxID=33906 RepID=UPI00036A675A|nr:3-deoxy-7-phosphoheptulonate synthase [Actinopolyspora mortivallis]
MESSLLHIPLENAKQQPDWGDSAQVQRVRDALTARPGLVSDKDVGVLRSQLARVALGEAEVVQAGDCAENPDECTSAQVSRKAAVLDLLAGTMKLGGHRPVVRAGRVAGQFSKPRSRPTEWVGDVELPSFRGHMVNSPEPSAEERRPDPLRLVTGYMAASDIMEHLGWGRRNRSTGPETPVWTSHEALLLDYEVPMLRRTVDGDLVLASTHWPWIGERTRQTDGAHVSLLANVVNPVAVKIGPNITTSELLTLCERLDPERDPGRLTLIVRMGVGVVAERLPALVQAVRAAGHPVVWMTDPMHGNTVTTAHGYKTRHLAALREEIREFRQVVRAAGGFPGGIHLETTPEEVVECVEDQQCDEQVGNPYTSFCDPRLTPSQATQVLGAWTEGNTTSETRSSPPGKPLVVLGPQSGEHGEETT